MFAFALDIWGVRYQRFCIILSLIYI